MLGQNPVEILPFSFACMMCPWRLRLVAGSRLRSAIVVEAMFRLFLVPASRLSISLKISSMQATSFDIMTAGAWSTSASLGIGCLRSRQQHGFQPLKSSTVEQQLFLHHGKMFWYRSELSGKIASFDNPQETKSQRDTIIRICGSKTGSPVFESERTEVVSSVAKFGGKQIF